MDSFGISSFNPDLTNRIIKIPGQYVAGGGLGDVYKCHLKDGLGTKEVAVKAHRFKLTLEGDGVDKSVKIIRRELSRWTRLKHPNIVPFLGIARGFGMHGSTSFVSSWMPNGTLQDFLINHDKRIVTPHRLHLLLGVANGLHYLHSIDPPIIHGDLNSNNVLIDADCSARLTDFGYATLVGATPGSLASRSPMESGSFRWIAPEQVFCNSEQGFRKTVKSDVYSFGSIALQTLSGRQPWAEIAEETSIVLCLAQGRKPRRPKAWPIDDQHWEFINACWSPNPEDRPTAKRIVAVVEQFFDYHSYIQPVQPIRDIVVASLSSSRLTHSRCGHTVWQDNWSSNGIQSGRG